MPRVIFQIGKETTRKRSQNINAFINNEQVDWSDDSGKFLTSFADRSKKGIMWYMYAADLDPGDDVRIKVTTFITDAGMDEELSFEAIYVVEEEGSVEEIVNPKVGMRGYPLLKGRVSELAYVSEADNRRDDIESFLNEGF